MSCHEMESSHNHLVSVDRFLTRQAVRAVVQQNRGLVIPVPTDEPREITERRFREIIISAYGSMEEYRRHVASIRDTKK